MVKKLKRNVRLHDDNGVEAWATRAGQIFPRLNARRSGE